VGELGIIEQFNGAYWREISSGLREDYWSYIQQIWGFSADDVLQHIQSRHYCISTELIGAVQHRFGYKYFFDLGIGFQRSFCCQGYQWASYYDFEGYILHTTVAIGL